MYLVGVGKTTKIYNREKLLVKVFF